MQKVETMLSVLTDTIPKGDDWLFEIKYDGYRILAFVDDKKVRLLTRNGQDYTNKFDGIGKSLKDLSKNNGFILDGEVVVADKNGRTDFSALQSSIKGNKKNFTYIVFDILLLNGEDLRELRLMDRKERLARLLENCPPNISISGYVIGKGKESFAAAKKLGLEGIIAKKINSRYEGYRSENWLKIKCYKRQEFIIGGYTTSDKNSDLAAILLGYYDKEKLIYIGKAGTGFSEKLKAELKKTFSRLESDKPHFENAPKQKNAVYLKPKLVAEIQFTEITAEKLLRQPSFKGLRTDKNPKDVILEQV